MTSETQVLKTNEFLRRRKLRLQQVREQSKDIAKKIRQRANSENLRQIVDLDAKKQKEYFDRQENLVKRLEVLYTRGLKNVGSGHHSAIDVTQEDVAINRDLSKLRGKEAAAALRKKRQEKLDEQKKLLDRKLQAREAANEISREKSSMVANKIITKTTSSNVSDDIAQKAASSAHIVQESNKDSESNNTEPVLINKNTIGTQWDADKMPQELEPTIPTLSLLIDNQGNLKDFEQEANKSEKNKRRDLFAVSKEMPSDLCRNQVDIPEIRDKIRPSLTLVSEYLQSRKLRLRDTESTNTIKKRHTDDISSLKQTIFRTRTSKIEAPGRGSTCTDNSKPESVHNRKGSVLMYNHCTRDTRDLPHSDEQLVVRELQTTEDAYSQAITEASTAHETDRECQNKIQDMRNRMAVTKQTVEKEYKDTINFLNSMPKSNTANVTKTTYMDERRQQLQKENRQHKMQQEYRKIQKECRKHHTCMNKNHNKSKSPSKQSDSGDIFDNKDFQYSWMPVPDGDGNLAVHTIPNSMKESKNSNGVKFSNVDSYHEYRSRHKHTPPTKDTTDNEKRCNKKRVKTVIIDKNNSTEESSTVSESSSLENLLLSPNRKVNQSDKIDTNLSDAERIIIYKILDTKNRKHCKEKNKLLSDIVKSLTSIEKVQKSAIDNNGPSKKVHKQGEQLVNKSAGDSDIFENIDEGLYRVNEEKGDNLSAMHYRIENNEGVADVEETNNGVCRNENLREAQKRDKGTFLQWQDGDDDPREKKLPSKPTKLDPVPVLPSAATSTSSFKTATNDKANSAVTDGGFIKLLDETGHQAAKFFLGGTNLLKDDAYEVVIQLRKKDGSNKETNKLITEEIPKKPFNGNKSTKNIQSNTLVERSVASENSVQTRPVADDLETVEVLAFRSFSEKESKTVSPRMSYEGTQATKGKSTINQATSYQNDQKGSESSADIRLINSCKDQKEVADKGTTLQRDSSAMQFETASRPATTTYTQTTNSPIHRPIYLHMSSSTSTAYMSPPEIILPKFLRHDVDLTDIETLDLSSRHTNERFVKNQCYPRRNVNKNNIKNVYKSSKQQTPPNTAKNCVKHKHSSSHNLCRKVLTSCKVARLDKKKCKCHNCGVNNPSKNNCKKQFHCGNNISAETLGHVHRKFVSGSVNSKNKHSSTRSHYKRNNSTESLNPIIKNYINTLLSLNRGGLKALEVAGQDCSSVATPSSSIINVPYNLAERNGSVENIISLEHIKKMLVQQVVDVHLKKRFNNINKAHIYKFLGKKTSQSKRKVHKVKSLNITKHLLTKNTTAQQKAKKQVSPSSLDSTKTFLSSNTGRIQSQSRSSPTLRQSQSSRSLSTCRNDTDKNASKTSIKKNNSRNKEVPKEISPEYDHNSRTKYPVHKATVTDTSPEPTKETNDFHRNEMNAPVNMPSQTRQNIDSDLMKLAEDKLNNMEKIADLTEKCTKRLSNLARVLEEVRKNKSLVYNYISNSDSADSQSDHKSDRTSQSPVFTENITVPNRLEFKSLEKIQLQIKSPEIPPLEIKTKESNSENNNVTVNEEGKTHSEYISFLTNIPKPTMFQLPGTKETTAEISDPISAISPLNTDTSSIEIHKFRPKPPAALSRVHLKCGQDLIVPHELSTVLEVDSPMSVKNKNQSSRYDTHNTSSRSSTEGKESKSNQKTEVLQAKKGSHNPDLLQGNKEFSKHLKLSSNESSDDSKFQMIDLKHFNEIMLEPFITVHEYAKKYNVAAPDEGSNFEDLQKDDAINDDISSLRSDGSLPDVIAELLKRNVITEPFKFETASNVNSTTVSSESTLSMLALTKARKNKKKSNVAFQNKENIGETTDTLSISSNPDLENAFKKLGMGWASSTLKKTKERLALSSSSNTSSSSLSQYKIKSFNRDIPALVTDSVSSVLFSQKELQSKSIFENSKNAKKQTNFTNSITVKEFLTNELANKITFTSNKSDINDTEEEFVSLFETKMPEGLKQQSQSNCEGPSNDSIPSGTNRARTSTPVQLFKSTTYQSSSCSNISNGLFSNADLSSVKMTSNSMKNHSTTDKDDLTIPNFSLKLKNPDCSKSD